MNQDELVVLTAKRTGVPEETTGAVLKAAEDLAKELADEPRAPLIKAFLQELATAPEREGEVRPERSVDVVEPQALEKAEAAFGASEESNGFGPMYSERSGLLA
jgi:hypothetical protein